MADYLNELRESVLEAYTGIIQGLKGVEQTPNKDVYLLEPHIQHVVALIKRIITEGDNTDSMIVSAAGFIGDLCITFGAHVLPLVDDVTITHFLAEGKRSKSGDQNRIHTICKWALVNIKKLRDQHTITQ